MRNHIPDLSLIKPDDIRPSLKVEFPFFKNLIQDSRGPGGELLPEMDQASVMIAVSPGYIYKFKESTLKLETLMTKSHIDALLSNKFGQCAFLVGYSATWTHFLIAMGMSPSPIRDEDLISLEKISLEAKKVACEKEQQFNKSFNLEIKKHSTQPLLKNKNGEKTGLIILSSELKLHEELYQKMLQSYQGHQLNNNQSDSKVFQNAVDLCIRPVVKRLYKELFTLCQHKKLYCRIKDEKTGKSYEIKKLAHEMMAVHVIEEMAHFLSLTDEYQINYILHEGNPKKEKHKDPNDVLLRTSMALFKPDIAHLGLWQPIVFPRKSPTLKPVQTNSSSQSALEQKSLSMDLNITKSSYPTRPTLASEREITEYQITLSEYLVSEDVRGAMPTLSAFLKLKTREVYHELLSFCIGIHDLNESKSQEILGDARVKMLYRHAAHSSVLKAALELMLEMIVLFSLEDYKRIIEGVMQQLVITDLQKKPTRVLAPPSPFHRMKNLSSQTWPPPVLPTLPPANKSKSADSLSTNIHTVLKMNRSKSLSAMNKLTQEQQQQAEKMIQEELRSLKHIG